MAHDAGLGGNVVRAENKAREAVHTAIRAAAKRAIECWRDKRAPTPRELAELTAVDAGDLEQAGVDVEQLIQEGERLKENRANFEGHRSAIVSRQQRRIRQRSGSGIEPSDIRTAGDLGFESALRQFVAPADLEVNEAFRRFAGKCVFNEMLAEATRRIPTSIRRIYSLMYRAEGILIHELMRQPSDEELAQRMARLEQEERGWKGKNLWTDEDLTKRAMKLVVTIRDARRAWPILHPDQFPVFEAREFGREEPEDDAGADDDPGRRLSFRPGDERDAPNPDREWIERGVGDVQLGERVRKLPAALAEVCHWLLGTWRYLARQHGRAPTEAELGTALGVSETTIREAKQQIEPLFSQLTVPVPSATVPSPSRPLVLPREIENALTTLPPSDRTILAEIFERGTGRGGLGKKVGAVNAAVKRATDRLFESVVRQVLDRVLAAGEQTILGERYRAGRFRLGHDERFTAAVRKLRGRLRELGLLDRIFSRDGLEVFTRRYLKGHTLDDIARSKLWPADRCLAVEFADVQVVVALLLPIDKKGELRHALGPPLVDAALDHFVRGVSETAEVSSTMTTLAWLLQHKRYLNFGRYAPATGSERETLTELYGDGAPRRSPTPAERKVLQKVVTSVFC